MTASAVATLARSQGDVTLKKSKSVQLGVRLPGSEILSKEADSPLSRINAGKARAEKATIRILRPNEKGVLKLHAQGVLVPGGYILTAAHCIKWDGTGAMALGDWYVETIQVSDGTQHKVSPCAVEPMTDIAVLAAVDGQEMFEECHAFEKFCEATEPVPVSEDDFPHVTADGPPVRVHILTHKRTWASGDARRVNSPPFGNVWVAFDTPIGGGTSGGPVIDDNGLLVGVVSHASEDPKACNGKIPRPHLALPAWVWNRIKRAPGQRGPSGAKASARRKPQERLSRPGAPHLPDSPQSSPTATRRPARVTPRDTPGRVEPFFVGKEGKNW